MAKSLSKLDLVTNKQILCHVRSGVCQAGRGAVSPLESIWFTTQQSCSWMNLLQAWIAHLLSMSCKFYLKWQRSVSELFSWPFTNLVIEYWPRFTSSWFWPRAMLSTTVQSRGWSLTSTALNVVCPHMWVTISTLSVMYFFCQVSY